MEDLNWLELGLVGILGVWTLALLWASWQIRLMVRSLAAERRAIRRWVRLKGVWEKQGGRWQ
jgi:hypothetical protein